MTRWLNIPNLLSVLRLVLVPFAVRAVYVGDHRGALVVFATAAVTDALDGPLARRLRCVTRVGAYLDPIADKALLSSTYLALGAAGAIPWWLVGLVFGRDLLILALVGAALLFTGYRDFPPNCWGKLSTGVQAVAAVWVIVARAFPSAGLPSYAMLWPAAAATAWSGLTYLWQAVGMAQSAFRKDHSPVESD
jgi:cardiolipin synthase